MAPFEIPNLSFNGHGNASGNLNGSGRNNGNNNTLLSLHVGSKTTVNLTQPDTTSSPILMIMGAAAIGVGAGYAYCKYQAQKPVQTELVKAEQGPYSSLAQFVTDDRQAVEKAVGSQ
jgi:uncharacterized membrane protein YebE (DUF533 family)